MPAGLKQPDPAPAEDARSPYERDFYTWTLDQAAALRAGKWRDLDIANLAEEIEDLGSEKFKQLESAYRVILLHMLKWDYQPERRSRSWTISIRTQRADASFILKDNPGLKGRLGEALERAYFVGRIHAGGETGMDEDVFPAECPYSLDEIMNRPFQWPER